MRTGLGGSEGRRSPSESVIEAVANRENIEPTEVEPPAYEPLYSVVDPEALDALFAPTHAGEDREGGGRIEFRYCGYDVTVDADGTVEVSGGRADRPVNLEE